MQIICHIAFTTLIKNFIRSLLLNLFKIITIIRRFLVHWHYANRQLNSSITGSTLNNRDVVIVQIGGVIEYIVLPG